MQCPKRLAERLRNELGYVEGVLDVHAAAANLGCDVEAGALLQESGVEAELRPHPSADRFLVRVDPTPARGWTGTPDQMKTAVARQRFRFRVCHELGHALHFDRRRNGEGPARTTPWRSSEEVWCDEFARAFLVPPTAVKELAPEAGTVFELQRRFDVSLEVATRALVTGHPHCEAALWFWPPDGLPKPEWLIRQWSTADAEISLRPWLRSNLLAQALEQGEAKGSTAALRHRARERFGSARCDRRRRQVVIVTSSSTALPCGA